MRVLVIDTALGACTAAVFDGQRALAIRSDPMVKGHQERLGGLVRDVMVEVGVVADGWAGVAFERLDRIGVTTGPGSFTGLRVGLAFAQGLGAALDRPVVGVSTLAALARSASPGSGPGVGPGVGDVAAVIDARRGQVYAQVFRDGVALSPPQALAIEDALRTLSAGGLWRLVGSGAPLLAALAPGTGMSPTVVEPLAAPTPEALAALTIEADPAAAPPSPLYLRAPDAVPPTRLPGQPRPAAVRP